MDRRFLSQPSVIKASRDFVCIRLMSYESAEEAKVLKRYWRPGSELQNTVFAILDPNGRALTRGTRSPKRFYRDANDMANSMNQIASSYRKRGNPGQLPVVDTVRLGMNVAACDSRPLAIIVSKNKSSQELLERKLAPYAWSDKYIGKVVYTAGAPSDLKGVIGASVREGFLFVSPNTYGTRAKVIAQLRSNPSSQDIQRALNQVVAWRPPQKAATHREHARAGRMQGASWQTAIPITDGKSRRVMQMRDRDRGRRGGYNRSQYR